MAIIGTVPRRCVNLPPGSLATLLGCVLRGRVQDGPAVEAFQAKLAGWLDAPHVFGASTGRSAFQLALEALDLPQGSEIIFPVVTFPVMPIVAQNLGYVPVFCEVDPKTYNAGPEHVEPHITEKTAGVLATHLFGRPAPIAQLARLCRDRGLKLMEDCAHACGVRVDGKQVGTFGDVGVFSFAQGKNMPCMGGGAIAVMDDAVAERARKILETAPIDSSGALAKQGFSVWIKWLLTRPLIFGLTAYQALKLKLWLGKDLMDSAFGDELIAKYQKSDPKTRRLANLQAAIGLRQLDHIDAFNAGGRENAAVLTEGLEGVTRVRVPPASGVHIYVYYPLGVDASDRDALRHHLLRRGVDTKCTDMADCSMLTAFRDEGVERTDRSPAEAALLEICTYPALSKRKMRKVAQAVREWADS
jgi:dTDP-4-amino-4,6-dideoxygalactose transaminase